MENILARSGCALLSLSLTSLHDVGSVFNLDEIRALVPHLSRLRELDVVGIPGGFFSALPASLPLLEMVSVSNILGFGTSTFSLEQAPRLRIATFTKCGLSSLPFMLPLSQLATITFAILFLGPVDVLRLLMQCHSLVECRLHINKPFRTNPDIVQNRLNLPRTHSLPFLTFFHLKITEVTRFSNGELDNDLTGFQILSLPHLSHFELDGTRSCEWFRAIVSGGTRLEVLQLSNFRGEADEMRLILESVPSLRTLKVDHKTSHRVIETRGLFDLLPKLETLHLPLLSDRQMAIVGDALDQWRAESSSASRVLRVVFQALDFISASTIPRLERMREAGWEVDITVQSSLSRPSFWDRSAVDRNGTTILTTFA